MGVVAMKLFSADLSHTTTVNSKCKYCLLLCCLSFLFTMAGPTRCPVRSTEEKPSDYGHCLSLSHQPPAFKLGFSLREIALCACVCVCAY